jgi:hypothetical protein
MLVMTAHQYVVEAESYDEARAKIVDLFEEGVVADHTLDVDCYPENTMEYTMADLHSLLEYLDAELKDQAPYFDARLISRRNNVAQAIANLEKAEETLAAIKKQPRPSAEQLTTDSQHLRNLR